MAPFLGKYRGQVVDNNDPLQLGRVLVEVPAISGTALGWALPCLPYAGPGVGFCVLPPIGASVWVEFEGGDPSYPIWTGCFWREGERPDAGPETFLIQAASVTIAVADVRVRVSADGASFADGRGNTSGLPG